MAYVNSGGTAYDADAQAFFTANSTLTDATKKNKVNQLFIDLKSYGLLSKFYAFYLLNLGDATKNKFNIVNPVDSDSAFRLVFSSGFTFSDSATTPNGSSTFAKTFLTPSTVYTDNSFHIGVYGTVNTPSRYDVGAWNGDNALITRYSANDNTYFATDSSTWVNASNTNNQGFIIGNYLSGTSSIKRNDSTIVSGAKTLTKSTTPFSIFASNRASDYSSLSEYSSLPMSLVCIGKGLTTQEQTDLNTCIQTYNS